MSSEWTTSSLLDHYEVRSGLSKPAKDFGSGYPFLTFKDVFYNYFTPESLGDFVQSTQKEREGCSVLRGDVFLTRTSETMHELGMSCVALRDYENATFNGFCKRLRPKPESELLPEYVGYYLRSPKFRRAMLAMSTMSTRASLNNEMIGRLEISFPSRKSQTQISEVLKSLDDRITLLRETNATLEAMAKALFKSWFVDFAPVHSKQQGRAPEGMDAATAALFPDRFEESELGKVPKGWGVSAVEEFAERVGMGPFGSNIKVETFVDTGVPVISGQHLKQLLVEDNKFNFITKEHAARLEKSCVREGDVIFTHAGSIGQVSLLHREAKFSSYVLSQRQFFLRCRKELMRPEWIALYFKSPAGQHQLLANTSQVGVPSIARPVSYLRSIRLLVPPPVLNQHFSSIAGSINDRVMVNRKQLNALSEIRDTLLPRLISGQLRLPEAQALVDQAA